MSASVYEIVTQKIIDQLESGCLPPWKRPWAGGIPKNLCSGKPYRGINSLVLGLCSPYASPWWLTFKQAKQRGGHVRKGEKSTAVLFFKMLEREQADGRKKTIPIARYYRVFNAEQCEGIEAPGVEERTINPIDACEEIMAGYPDPPTLQHREARAYYQPSTDTINLPRPGLFDSYADYFATWAHEAGHSVGAAHRLARPAVLDTARFGSHAYSKEELVAEFTSALVCGVAKVDPAVIDNSAAYLQHWLDKLKNDRRMLVRAAGQAQQAADWILGKHPKQLAHAIDVEATQAEAA